MLRRLAAVHKPTAVLLLAAVMLASWGLASQQLGGADRTTDTTPVPVQTDAEAIGYRIDHWSSRSQSNDLDYLSRTNLAVAHLALGRLTGDFDAYDTAEAPLREALEINPRYSPTLTALAAVHLGRHEFPQALEAARQAYEIDPSSDEALAALGDANLEIGNYDEATAAFAQLLRRVPGPTSEARMARLAFLHGRPGEAIERAQRALDLAGPGAGVSYSAALASYALDAGDTDLAARTATAALAKYPDSVAAIETLAQVRAMRGELEAAADLYERILHDGPDAGAHSALGDIYTRLDRPDQAQEHYEQVESAARSVTESPVVFDRDVALFLADNGLDPDRAVQLAERDLLNRRDIYAYDTLAWARYAAGDHEGAEQAIDQALALGTEDPHLFYRAGVIAAANNDSDAARRWLTQALAINPNFDVIYAPDATTTLENLSP